MAAGIAKGVLVRIESLMLFLRVVESGSISRAARESFISQQGASAAIKGLEQDFGIELFDRASSRLQLTARGRRFAREAEQVVAAYRRMQAVAALDSDVGPSEPLRIVTTPHALHVPLRFSMRTATSTMARSRSCSPRKVCSISWKRSPASCLTLCT